MKHYRQLTLEQRIRIQSCIEARFTQVETAHALGVHKSTIGRELARNSGPGGYRPDQAQGLLRQRRQHQAAGRAAERR